MSSAVALLAYLPLLPHALAPSASRLVTVDQLGQVEMVDAQSCLTLYDPMDCGLPGSFVHGIFPGKNTGVVAIPFSRGYSSPRD